MNGRFDPFAWLVSFDVKKARYVAYTCFLIGPVMLGIFVYRMTQIPWDVSRDSPVAISIAGGCDPNGGVYTIRVEGMTYHCGGGDLKCATESEAPVAYVRDHPRHCRLLRNVARPSLYEISELLFGLIPLTYAAAFVTWDAAWLERLSRPDGAPPKSLAYLFWRAAFLLSVLAFIAEGLWENHLYG
jgi:hypothetical protein